MAEDLFDIAVIGGGVNGCGIARDAAGRGARVLLLEADDLANGTSSASTKLIHGGLRYLEHYEFALVREALSERERLWAIAPHIIRPLRFVLPHVRGLRSRWLLRLGLFVYDHIGGRKRLPPAEAVDLSLHPAGGPLKGDLKHAFVYSDCWVDDARLVVLNARSAADLGAEVRTRCRVDRLERVAGHWRIEASGPVFHARAVVNAAGPSVLDVLGRAGKSTSRHIRLVRGSHIVVPRLFEHSFAYFFQLPDGRIFFAIPYEQDFTLIGTTDRDHEGSLEGVQANQEEIAYLCEAVNRYFRAPITPQDVVWTYSGVRPLIDDGSGKPEAATRGYHLELSQRVEGAPLLSVFGGKITTYRHLAQEAVDMLGTRLDMLSMAHWTDKAPLPGGDFHADEIEALIAGLAQRYPFLEPSWALRLARSYGTSAATILGDAKCLADCGEHFGHGLTERELCYLVEREWCRTTEDALWRRTKLGLRMNVAQTKNIATYLSREQSLPSAL
ncbi:glycerol-3-phosphate dehydrogenase [Novosphingobium sp.]|uniref:glycerol-3-phosphate dehydrogenase n=1 Tax=Novosphingobium sp. TaxID=1874826 RepID=UPI002B4A1FCE|nr:glycerol-3-phosphate dehydrogenase [Novosphingobium sp.]HKR93324.1 glycerol-3-phosphate dehydrogenase [Novosphingobium sp.]